MVLALLLQAEGLVVDGAVPGHVAHEVLRHTTREEKTVRPAQVENECVWEDEVEYLVQL